jgi:hypothetical protein
MIDPNFYRGMLAGGTVAAMIAALLLDTIKNPKRRIWKGIV